MRMKECSFHGIYSERFFGKNGLAYYEICIYSDPMTNNDGAGSNIHTLIDR
ncbi:hypothetical protein Bca101_069675 [Brassica carinata]